LMGIAVKPPAVINIKTQVVILILYWGLIYYHVPGGFAVGAEPARRPGEAPREEVSSKNGWGWEA
jgi:hypothetical protein